MIGFYTLKLELTGRTKSLAANETGQTGGARFDPLLQLRASIPEISKCRQLIVVNY
jgi:hypothetical protein